MMDFLSDVFEFEVDSISDSIQRGTLFIKLLESAGPVSGESNSGIIFSFKVNSDFELKEIMDKYNFFLYRKSSPTPNLEKCEITQDDSKKVLTISDVDKRLWRFELEV